MDPKAADPVAKSHRSMNTDKGGGGGHVGVYKVIMRIACTKINLPLRSASKSKVVNRTKGRGQQMAEVGDPFPFPGAPPRPCLTAHFKLICPSS